MTLGEREKERERERERQRCTRRKKQAAAHLILRKEIRKENEVENDSGPLFLRTYSFKGLKS